MASLNDVVSAGGSYNEAKAALTAGLSQEAVAGDMSYNEGLEVLATPVAPLGRLAGWLNSFRGINE
jgi:hypothetical protein